MTNRTVVVGSAQKFMSHREKWKETLIKQAQKTIEQRKAREAHLKKPKREQEEGN